MTPPAPAPIPDPALKQRSDSATERALKQCSDSATGKVPAQAEGFVVAMGLDAAVDFLVAFGGRDTHVTTRLKASSEIAVAVGIEAARRLARVYGGQRLYVPMLTNWCAQQLLARGLSRREVARRLRRSERAIRYLANDPERSWQGPEQLPLL